MIFRRNAREFFNKPVDNFPHFVNSEVLLLCTLPPGVSRSGIKKPEAVELLGLIGLPGQ